MNKNDFIEQMRSTQQPLTRMVEVESIVSP